MSVQNYNFNIPRGFPFLFPSFSPAYFELTHFCWGQPNSHVYPSHFSDDRARHGVGRLHCMLRESVCGLTAHRRQAWNLSACGWTRNNGWERKYIMARGDTELLFRAREKSILSRIWCFYFCQRTSFSSTHTQNIICSKTAVIALSFSLATKWK